MYIKNERITDRARKREKLFQFSQLAMHVIRFYCERTRYLQSATIFQRAQFH